MPGRSIKFESGNGSSRSQEVQAGHAVSKLRKLRSRGLVYVARREIATKSQTLTAKMFVIVERPECR